MINWFQSKVTPKSQQDDGSQTIKSLPASWYRSSAMYELERRAIFSRRWLLVSHRARFAVPGDYVRITEAGFTFFLIKDRQGQIKAHHNVCRHRAYPLIENERGHLNIIACKYHGWSYGLDGNLAKAPKYQDAPAFDKSINGLFRIHVHVDNMGFIWVNLDSKHAPEVLWEQDFASVDLQPRLQHFNMDKYRFDHQWEMIGEYNWKTLADNYNECYHCPTGHPALNSLTDISKYWVETAGGHIQHYNVDKPDREGMGIYSTYYYPNASMTISPIFFYIMRVIPISANQTKMEYEFYRHEEATDEEFAEITSCFRQILSEDKDLCTGAQKNLNSGIFLNGELHPQAEKGPLFFQALTRDIVTSHHEQEEQQGAAIWPATPKQMTGEQTKADMDFCNSLQCAGDDVDRGLLAW
ncbi:aromatic ring-hydroxylating oxygenase subunit alpha [Aspergillus chevalieri]|uniref:Choline monooxygenase, chloroplastic n=1 Tax=Aspergillus chevalieri TaxID=182096 RepID=A0A7R7ZPV1_ASPCH|nr:uncharacterized protein ACHE_60236A [Aspergillus chevalieri]BCR90350.1 hypothetical protein ACHE_60236A [Aspergillus chevalieri]